MLDSSADSEHVGEDNSGNKLITVIKVHMKTMKRMIIIIEVYVYDKHETNTSRMPKPEQT